jgi:tRNA threonylcarbamoyladenosine biosynthesis protein TsaB
MPYILAFDTSGDRGSIALAEGARLIEEIALEASDGFGHILFSEIGNMLIRHQVTFRDIACFATAAGPGSFTGVRVGIAAAKGLADAAGCSVVAVSNLQALAWFGSGDLRAPHIDARRGEIYGALYDSRLRLIQDEIVAPFDSWAAALPPGAVQIAQRDPLARAIAAIAWRQFEAGWAKDPAGVDANYVRRSDAELMWRES